MSKTTKKIIYSIAALSGTTIGVGLFSLPYITSKVGILAMVGYFLVLGALIILINSFFGELALKTPDFKRMPGFAKFYLGNWGKKVSLVSAVLGSLGASLAYLIVGGKFLESLLFPIFGGSNLIYTVLYFSFGAFLIFFGMKLVSKIEFWGLVLFFVILMVIFIQGIPFLKIENLLVKTGDAGDLFLPYGAILFSLWGAALIPEVEEMLSKDKKLLKKIIPIAVLIPALVYLFFIFLILGITGEQTTQSALTGLKDFLGDRIFSLGLFFGLMTTFTSFIALGLNFKKVLWYDLKINKNLAWAITCFVPLFLFLIGLKSFISVISVVGGVMLGIDGILILLMYKKIKPRKKFLIYPLALAFLGGIIYEIAYFIK